MKKNSPYQDTEALAQLTLGQKTQYQETYAPSLLQAVPRKLNRDDLQLGTTDLPFNGFDLWNLYELSWLNQKGKPVVATGVVKVPASSRNLIESKSFKLYLNSFNQTTFACTERVIQTLTEDLSRCADAQVEVSVNTDMDAFEEKLGSFAGECIDKLDIEVDNYQLTPEALKGAHGEEVVTESLYSHLLKSNCLVTNQPDWGSVLIRYQGKQIDKEKLLRYLISFRQHNEFHEQCVERIFCDIVTYCRPEKLTVYARYTRRGGLDINPFRSNHEALVVNPRLLRQ